MLACQECLQLKYVSKTWSAPARLMEHFGKLRETLERKPGRKGRRYWHAFAKERQYTRQVMEGLQRFLDNG